MEHNKNRSLRPRLFALALCCALLFSVLPAAAAADPYGNSLLLWLGFNEGKGTTVSDLSGHVADATVEYGFTHAAFMEDQDPQWRTGGAEGGCLLFDGCTTYVEYPNDALRVSGDSLTVSAWVAPRAFDWDDPNGAANGSDTLTAIVDQADRPGKRGFILGYQRYGILSFQVGTGDSWFSIWSNGDNLETYAWNYVTAVFDGQAREMVLYLNGQRVASRSLPAGAAIAASDKPLMVGRNGSAGRYDASLLNLPSGYLDEIKLYSLPLTDAQVDQSYRSVTPSEIVFEELWLQNILTGDYTRPQFHGGPYQFWMNEPHAPIYFNGMYHLFFQENMTGPYWRLIYWGHLVSPDMVNWKPVKEAIVSTEDSVVPDGVWSGGSTLDKNGVPLLFFTAGNDNYTKAEGLISNQNIGVAYPKDLTDPELTEWVIADELAVIQQKGQGRTKEFRDPSIWKEGDTWCMVLCSGSTTGAGGSALLYTTDTLELREDGTLDMDWQYRGPVYEMPHQPTMYGTSWELPILLPLTNSAGTVSKYVFIISPAPAGVADNKIYYWLGSFDLASGKFTPDPAFGDTPRLLDYGANVFTGPSAFRDPVSGDVVLFSIMQDQRSAKDQGASGWAHTVGLARKLWLNDDGSDVKIAPLGAIQSLEERVLAEGTDLSLADANQKLSAVQGDMLHIQVTADVSQAARFTIDLKKGGWMDCTSYTYDTASQTIQGWTSNKAPAASTQSVSGPLACPDGILNMDIYVDRSLVEAFFNQDKAITTRAYTLDPQSQAVSLFSQGQARILSLRVTAMGAINSARNRRFWDVVPGSWYDAPVEWAAQKQIANGTGANTFSPDMACSTAQVLTFLWRSQGCPAPALPTGTEYYAQAVAWAQEKGLLSEGGFADGPCTRAAIVEYLWKLAGSPETAGTPFWDVPQDAPWAQAVNWAVAQSVTSGTGGGRFSPDLICSRSQAVTLLYRALGTN